MNVCPYCGSNKVKINYPEITCLSCGYSEPLIDYPVSHREHKASRNNFHKRLKRDGKAQG